MPASRQGRTARRHAAVYRVSSYSTFCVHRENYITHVKKSFRAIDCITMRFMIFLSLFWGFFFFLINVHVIVGHVFKHEVNVTIFQAACIIMFTQTKRDYSITTTVISRKYKF